MGDISVEEADSIAGHILREFFLTTEGSQKYKLTLEHHSASWTLAIKRPGDFFVKARIDRMSNDEEEVIAEAKRLIREKDFAEEEGLVD